MFEKKISIQAYQEKYKYQVITLISEIQQKEFNICITPEQQPDLKNISDFYQKRGNFWIALDLDNDSVVGTIALFDVGNKGAALRKMFVQKDYRGKEKGIAKQLLETLMQWATSKEFKTIYLGTTPAFLAAHRFYEKNGFIEIFKEELPESFPILDVDKKFYKFIIPDAADKLCGPNPNNPYPFLGLGILPDDRQVIFLKNFITRSNINVGDYTYYHDVNDAERFQDNNVLYNFSKEQLIIGKFCEIACGTKFIMTNGHKFDGFSAYLFADFKRGWDRDYDYFETLPSKGDIVVGNDVWFGYESLILPGVHIGDGAIIGARAVVTKDVPAYSVVAGNPARVVKMRFDDAIIQELLKIKWWDWPVEKITRNILAIIGCDLQKLQSAA